MVARHAGKIGLVCMLAAGCASANEFDDSAGTAASQAIMSARRAITLAPTATPNALAAQLFDALARAEASDPSLEIAVSGAGASLTVAGADDATPRPRSARCVARARRRARR